MTSFDDTVGKKFDVSEERQHVSNSIRTNHLYTNDDVHELIRDDLSKVHSRSARQFHKNGNVPFKISNVLIVVLGANSDDFLSNRILVGTRFGFLQIVEKFADNIGKISLRNHRFE